MSIFFTLTGLLDCHLGREEGKVVGGGGGGGGGEIESSEGTSSHLYELRL